MCFLADNADKKPLVAVKDINVYKIVRKNLLLGAACSIYHPSFFWKFNTEFHQPMLIGKYYGKYYETNVTVIDEGFHSYSPENTFMKIYYSPIRGCNTLQICSMKCNSNTIDCHSNFDDYWKVAIMKCVIPAGSRYFENRWGEIVSDTIKPISCELIDFDGGEEDVKIEF